MQKVYERINWENEPSIRTPLNEDNLNKIDYALNEIDSRVLEIFESVKNIFNLNPTSATQIPNGTDFDTLKTLGNYKVLSASAASSMINCPVGTAGRLTVIGTTATNRLLQTYTVNESKCRIFMRFYNGSSWGGWVEPVNKADLDKVITELDKALSLSSTYTEEVPDGTDFDTLKTTGNYKVSTSSSAGSMINCPSSVGGRLTVLTTTVSSRIFQKYLPNDKLCREWIRFFDGSSWSEWRRSVHSVDLRKSFNMLVIGNSFTQDAMAYVPPILEELLPDYDITIGVCYKSSASIKEHVAIYYDTKPYTIYAEWTTANQKWLRFTSDKTLSNVMSRRSWDVISIQGSCGVMQEVTELKESSVYKEIIQPMQVLLRMLQRDAKKPFSAVTFQWLGRVDGNYTSLEVFEGIADKINIVMDNVGLMDYVPVGCAMQSARTNPTLQALGVDGDMLNDGTHMQAGLPALLASYTIVLKIMEWLGEKNVGIYRSTFIPTDENILAMNVSNGNTSMTHGEIEGITEENIRAIQEIANMALRKPTVVTDCEDIIYSSTRIENLIAAYTKEILEAS